MNSKVKKILRLAVDIIIAVLYLVLMAYQATRERIHEWVGIGMAAVFIIHQLLNLPWYKALLSGKGKWTVYRKVMTAVDLLLLVSTVLAAFSGMAMSVFAVPFLYGMAKLDLARRLHLTFSHWGFILAGVHLGFHLPSISAKYIREEKTKRISAVAFTCLAGLGLFMFFRSHILDYLLMLTHFAFFWPGTSKFMVFTEYLLIFILWTFIGYICAVRIVSGAGKGRR